MNSGIALLSSSPTDTGALLYAPDVGQSLPKAPATQTDQRQEKGESLTSVVKKRSELRQLNLSHKKPVAEIGLESRFPNLSPLPYPQTLPSEETGPRSPWQCRVGFSVQLLRLVPERELNI